MSTVIEGKIMSFQQGYVTKFAAGGLAFVTPVTGRENNNAAGRFFPLRPVTISRRDSHRPPDRPSDDVTFIVIQLLR